MKKIFLLTLALLSVYCIGTIADNRDMYCGEYVLFTKKPYPYGSWITNTMRFDSLFVVLEPLGHKDLYRLTSDPIYRISINKDTTNMSGVDIQVYLNTDTLDHIILQQLKGVVSNGELSINENFILEYDMTTCVVNYNLISLSNDTLYFTEHCIIDTSNSANTNEYFDRYGRTVECYAVKKGGN